MIDKNILNQEKIDLVVSLYRQGRFEDSLKQLVKLISLYSNEPFLYNLKGMCEIKIGNFNFSIISFNKAIKLNKNYVEAYNNLATTLINLGEFTKAIEKLKMVIKLNPNYVNAYNNLASAYSDLGEFDNALIYFDKLLKLSPNYPGVKENIIKILTFFRPKKTNLNNYTKVDNELKKINYKTSTKILDEDVVNIYQNCKKILSGKIKASNYSLSQIWKRNEVELNCTRHFDVFNNFNVIPKFCFSCFKIQIDLKSVTDLFKLYLIFNNLKILNGYSRKCLVELRKFGTGSYKGLIYCSSYEDAKRIYEIVKNYLEINVGNKFIIKIRRGCTEFGIAYPEFKDLNKEQKNFMKYDKSWREKENIIDKKIPKKNRINQRILKNTLGVINLNDVLIMENWLMYAKIIGDEDYKKFDKELIISEFIRKQFFDQKGHRQREYKKNIFI